MIKVFLLFVGIITLSASFIISPAKDHLKDGKEVYILYCQNCHMENGEGLEGVYPPIAKTNYLKNTKKIIDVIFFIFKPKILLNL